MRRLGPRTRGLRHLAIDHDPSRVGIGVLFIGPEVGRGQ